MHPTDFSTTAPGQCIRTADGHWAYVPNPPPPEIRYDAALVVLLSEADTALSELSGLGRQLPNPNLLIRPYVNREAIASSRIEGTHAEFRELRLDELDPQTPIRELEVAGVLRLLRDGPRNRLWLAKSILSVAPADSTL